MNIEIIKNIIDSWDPINLLIVHTPADEYIKEIEQIYEFALNTNEVDRLAIEIQQIFIKAFGDKVYTCTYNDCFDVAKRIMEES